MSGAHEDEYHEALIEMLELIWGKGFMTPGGAETVRRTVGDGDLRDRLVLDLGAGLGGADLLLARDYGARVIGFDLEAPLVERARSYAHAAGLADRVEFRLVEPGPIAAEDEAFDAVYSSGVFTQIENKLDMFKEIRRVLRPGGAFFAYDWMRGPEPYSDDMRTWFRLEGLTYAMETLESHERLLSEAGFVQVVTTEDGGWYRAECHAELARMSGGLQAEMRALLGAERTAHFLENWRVMTVVLDRGELRPGYYRGVRPG